jgi:hypothetical protein
MKEEFLHYIWKYSLYNREHLCTDRDEAIEIIQPGEYNTNAGPDFINARIRIGKTLWAGNVEIHTISSDWDRHHHTSDKAYDNVILQVVSRHDQPVKRTNGEHIPTLTMEFDPKYYENYSRLLESRKWVPCENEIKKVEKFRLNYWLNTLLVERLENKAVRIFEILKQTGNSWEETFYIHLARNFGLKVNADPFEILARSLPLKYLARHKNNIIQLEAMLFGQAGFLNEAEPDDTYYNTLKKEYDFLRKKYLLKPLEKHLWKFLRLRPSNFPTIRIAQFSSLVLNSSHLFSRILECKTPEELMVMFSYRTSKYWDTHYTFGKSSKEKKKNLGKATVQTILINTVIPFLFVYGKARGSEELKDRALDFLYALPAESNAMISHWQDLGMTVDNAFYTQALLQLKNCYCDEQKCLFCQIGHSIITANIT